MISHQSKQSSLHKQSTYLQYNETETLCPAACSVLFSKNKMSDSEAILSGVSPYSRLMESSANSPRFVQSKEDSGQEKTKL